MTVHFIGAGPGAADLITVRGRDLIAACPVCLYAGSLVAPEILSWCPDGARIIDAAVQDAFASQAVRPREFGGSSGTTDITQAVIDRVSAKQLISA